MIIIQAKLKTIMSFICDKPKVPIINNLLPSTRKLFSCPEYQKMEADMSIEQDQDANIVDQVNSWVNNKLRKRFLLLRA